MLIPFDTLCKKYSIKPEGVLHIGANNAAECETYYANGVKRSVWIEALPDVYKELKEVVSKYPKTIALNACVSDVDGHTVQFNVSSNHGESSSMLEFGSHAQAHPDVTFINKIRLVTSRVDTLMIKKGINIREFDFLNIDLQGAELLALRGMGDMLRLFKFVYIELNREELYKGCAMFEDVKSYLESFGFVLKEVKWTGAGWGDGFFIKDQSMNSVFKRQQAKPALREGIVNNIPDEFMQEIKFHYPPDNHLVFERWYYQNYNEQSERIYLPIQFTGFLVNNSFGNDPHAVARLQDFVDKLDRSKKYYTIHQFDLGCMVDFKDLDILVFGMAGGRIDYCLPLLCQPHKFEFNVEKTLFASFIGRRTHPVRDKIIDALKDKQGCYISEAKHDMSSYCSIIAHSIFTICGRGFGNNSFRVQEALQYGSIPVIISDERLEPHGIPFEEYGYFIHSDNVDSVYTLLTTLTTTEIKLKQGKLKHYYEKFFSYSGTKSIILEQLKK